jgi:hypothetical protein
MNSPFIKTKIENLVNRIKVNPGEYLFPLYECVVNSIQAIKEVGEHKGTIEIYIKRSASKQLTTDEGIEKYSSIESFEIVDNGVGFNEVNIQSFDEVYTPYKLKLGCKGIGRFISLVTFLKVAIDSNFYDDKEKKFYSRQFEFDILNGVKPISFEESNIAERKTKVTLFRYRDKYLKNPNTETIAVDLLEHIITYFVDNLSVKVKIYDDAAEQPINLNKLYEEKILTDDVIDEFKINNDEFSLVYLRNYLHKTKSHKIDYCGNGRKVLSESLSDLIPNLNTNLEDDPVP